MASIFQPPKITAEQLSGLVLEYGEIVHNTTDHKLYTGNGANGGIGISTDVTYIEITDGSQEIHLSKDQFYFQNDPNAFNTLNLHIEGNNASIIFNTSAEGEFQFTIDVPENFSINKPFSFESGKRYVISVDNFLILWSEVQKYE